VKMTIHLENYGYDDGVEVREDGEVADAVLRGCVRLYVRHMAFEKAGISLERDMCHTGEGTLEANTKVRPLVLFNVLINIKLHNY